MNRKSCSQRLKTVPVILTMAVSCIFCVLTVLAQDVDSRSTNLDERPLDDALQQLADITDSGIIYDPALVKGKLTACRLDEGSTEELITCILLGTGIQYRKLDSGIYVLEKMSDDSDEQQETRRVTIHGRVIDAETQEPLPGTNVFLANTSMGAATGTDGYFEFVAEFNREEYTLVASMVGYDVTKKTVSIDDVVGQLIGFSLTPKTFELSGIEVTSSAREWRRYLDRFEELIFSTTDNGRNCRLVNPEVLNLRYDEEQESILASVEQPLIIENDALGYHLVLHDVVLSGEEGRLHYSGVVQFEDLEPEDDRQNQQWKISREEAYRGSMRHFLLALIKNRLEEEDFKVYKVDIPGQLFNRTPVNREELIIAGADISVDYGVLLSVDTTLLVLYLGEKMSRMYRRNNRYKMSSWSDQWFQKETGVYRDQEDYQTSWLTLTLNQIYVDKWGNASVDGAFLRAGYWAWERLGEALPYDYVPEE